MVAAKHMRPPPDAALAAKEANKARKAAKRKGGATDKRALFRRFTSPGGFEASQ